ncbi:hypothetical protein Tco_0044513 [Tanacetum coccineum]
MKEMIKKFRLEDSKPMKTPMSTKTKLMKDEESESVDNTKYRGMIGSLLYLMASRPDIMFSVCLCARFQEDPKTSHLDAVKRIFQYIKGTMHLGLWYPKGSGIETVVYANSDHAGDYVDRKRTSGICTFMGCCLTSWFSKKQTALAISTIEGEYVSAEKACQQALWMKQALFDYGISLDDILIMYCNDISTAKAVLMANFSSYGSNDLSEVSDSETYQNDMANHSEKANQEKNNESLTAELERYKERVKTFEQRLNIDLSTREKMIDSQMDDMIKEKLVLKQQIDSLEQNISNQIKEKEYLLQTFTVFKNESKEKESKYMDKEIDLEKKITELDNIVYKVGQSAQTVHIVISSQHVASLVIDDEDTLILEEESRFQMLAKQNDPMSKEKKVNTTPINYVELNRLSKDFGKRFVPQQEFSAEQAFCLKKLKCHLGQFNNVVKKRITPDAITEGEWGFEHTKKAFNEEVIPFKNSLQTLVKDFENGLVNELNEVKTVFNQMEAVVDCYYCGVLGF